MAQQTIGVGAAANDGTGDPLRDAYIKCNDNFTELYGGPGGKTLDTDGTLAANSDTHVATQKAVKTYVDGAVAGATGTYTDEKAQDAVAAMLAAGSHTNITVSYNDASNSMSLAVSGLATYTDENAQDAVATMLGAGTDTGLVVTYNDAGNAYSIAIDGASAAQVQAGTASKVVTPDVLISAAVPQTLTDGATISWDMAAGFNAKVTLGGNRTLTVSNPKQGLTYSLGVNQDGTGSRTMTWPASFDWGTTGAPTLTTTASKRDRITLFCTDAATPKFDAFLSGKGFG